MASVMRLLGWKSEGLRCPDHEIRCHKENGAPFRVTLVQMPNGTGKTTTLTLLRAALSGVAEQWDSATVKSFQKRNNASLDSRGRFSVFLLLNGKRMTVTMEFDFDQGKVRYKTTYGSGQSEGFHPPAEFRQFLNSNFVNFFVFDGELAYNLLDKTHADAESVVETLFHVRTLNQISDKVEEYWKSKTEKGKPKDERALTRRKNVLTRLQDKLKKLEDEKQKLECAKQNLEEAIRKQQSVYDQELTKEKNRSTKIDAAKQKLNTHEEKVRNLALEVLDMMRDPEAISPIFAQILLRFKHGLDRVKLPERAAREFFEELAEEPECVCGRPIDSDEIRNAIRARAFQYLSSEDVALLNSIKTSIQEKIGHSTQKPEEDLRVKMQELKKECEKRHDAYLELQELQREAEQSDPGVKRAKEEIDRLQDELKRINLRLERFSDGTHNLEQLRKDIKEAEKAVAEAADTLMIKQRRDILKEIIANAIQKARDRLVEEIIIEANQRIRQLMPYNNISISNINRCLVLKGQEGGSVGETLSIAYAFLATLFTRTQHELPFIVDSPAGSIDYAVRPKIGELLPRLTPQFVAFTISSERERFVGPLKSASGGDIQFITLFRKGPKELEQSARASLKFEETQDGIIVWDEQFFQEFQLQDEEGV